MLPHDLVLEGGILPREDLVEGGPKHRDRLVSMLDGGRSSVCHSSGSTGSWASFRARNLCSDSRSTSSVT
jgi:hypothetical protein